MLINMWIHNINPIIFSWHFIEIRYYGILFVIGIILAFLVGYHLFKKRSFSLEDLWSLTLYIVIGALIGARLGHIIFYNLDYFLQHPIEIFYINQGGLASHGAAIGIIIAYWLFTKVHRTPFNKYADLFCVVVPLTAGFVRIGNFFNSEIVGRPTSLPWAVKFPLYEVDPVWRHPSQIYEALIAWAIFFFLLYFYKKWQPRLPAYTTAMLFLLLYFSSRFLVEFVKEYQFFSPDFPLTMGQILSLPFILLAIIILIIINKKKNNNVKEIK